MEKCYSMASNIEIEMASSQCATWQNAGWQQRESQKLNLCVHSKIELDWVKLKIMILK